MPNKTLMRACGVALAAAGSLIIILNVVLTPMLPVGVSSAETAAVDAYTWRMSLATLTAALLVFGTVGIYLRQAEAAGVFGFIAFCLAFFGSALLMAYEWSQVFLIHTLAVLAPTALDTLDGTPSRNLYDLGAMVAVLSFTIAWLVFAISMIRSGAFSKIGPLLVIAGFFAVPLLGALVSGLWGQIIGNIILGAGWIYLGYELLTGQTRPSA